jgi:hypothetical protein
VKHHPRPTKTKTLLHKSRSPCKTFKLLRHTTKLLLPLLCCLYKMKMMNSLRMQTSNTRKSSSMQTPSLRRAQSLPNELGREVVGRPLFWFKAPKRKISTFKNNVCHDSKPPRRRWPQLPRLVRLRARTMSPTVDSQIPDLISLKLSSDTNGNPQTVDCLKRSDATDNDTRSNYSTDDDNEGSCLYGLSFLDEAE